VPLEGFKEAFGQGDMTTRVLKSAIGSSWVVDLAHYFAFFAIVTSFLGVALSFVDFLADGLHTKKNGQGKLILCLLVIVLPFICALIYPKIFLTALRYAGSFGAVTLFGILPVAMVWAGRYYKNKQGPKLLPGGKWTLSAILIIAVAVIVLQVVQDLRGAYT
jgi:tyrosine-specific transport protein